MRSQFVPDRNRLEALIQLTFDLGMAIHQDIGPGLLESVYEATAGQHQY
jgi:hypothetical protein